MQLQWLLTSGLSTVASRPCRSSPSLNLATWYTCSSIAASLGGCWPKCSWQVELHVRGSAAAGRCSGGWPPCVWLAGAGAAQCAAAATCRTLTGAVTRMREPASSAATGRAPLPDAARAAVRRPPNAAAAGRACKTVACIALFPVENWLGAGGGGRGAPGRRRRQGEATGGSQTLLPAARTTDETDRWQAVLPGAAGPPCSAIEPSRAWRTDGRWTAPERAPIAR